MAALHNIPLPAIGSTVYVGLIATVAGFGVWNYLIRNYSASAVAPFSLLVPVFGLVSAAVFVHESISPLRMVAAVLIIGGVLAGVLGRRQAAPMRPALSKELEPATYAP